MQSLRDTYRRVSLGLIDLDRDVPADEDVGSREGVLQKSCRSSGSRRHSHPGQGKTHFDRKLVEIAAKLSRYFAQSDLAELDVHGNGQSGVAPRVEQDRLDVPRRGRVVRMHGRRLVLVPS